jgi:hypothetical protein
MEKQDQMVHIPEVVANKLKLTKVSLNQMENFRIFKQMKLHIQDSKKLQILHLMAISMRPDAWKCLS